MGGVSLTLQSWHCAGLVLINGSRVKNHNCPKILKNWKIYFEDIIETQNE